MSNENRIAIVLGVLTLIVAIMQLMYPQIPPYIGWPIVGILAIVILIVLLIGRRKQSAITDKNTSVISESIKVQATKLHNIYISKEREFWLALEKVPNDEKALENQEVKNAIYNMQIVTNKLATLISRNDFDEFMENLLNFYNKFAMFHFKSDDHSVSMMKNRINRKIRMYIRKIKN